MKKIFRSMNGSGDTYTMPVPLPSSTLALVAALYHWKDINEPERLREDMGPVDHNGSGAGDDRSVLENAAEELAEEHQDRL